MALNTPLRNDAGNHYRMLPDRTKGRRRSDLHRRLEILQQLSGNLAAVRDMETLQLCLTATFTRWLPGTTARLFPNLSGQPASDNNPIGWAHESGLPMWLEESFPCTEQADQEGDTTCSRSIIALPLRFAGAVLGCMVLHAPHPKHFSALDFRLAHLAAAHVSSALHGILSRQQLEEASCRLRAQERKLAEVTARLQELADKDDLTGLFNKRSLLAHLETEISRARRYGGELSCLMIDLDGFKPINDSCGHLAGDQVLRQLGDLFRSCCRESDFIARYGGDEFTVILPQTGAQGAASAAEKLRRRVRTHSFIAGTGQRVSVSLSIGLTTCPGKTWLEGPQVLAAADSALYAAKRAGGDTIFAADLMGKESRICQIKEPQLTQYACTA
jgi:diguanylate cyclase (GGDEF)-like protein